MSAVKVWGIYGALELQDEALHPLQLARTVGRDGPCSHTPCACTCNTWLSLTKFQDASALKQLASLCMQIMPKHWPHTLTSNPCLPPLSVVTRM